MQCHRAYLAVLTNEHFAYRWEIPLFSVYDPQIPLRFRAPSAPLEEDEIVKVPQNDPPATCDHMYSFAFAFVPHPGVLSSPLTILLPYAPLLPSHTHDSVDL